MGKEEKETGAGPAAAGTDQRPQKASRLESTDSGCGSAAVEDWGSNSTEDGSSSSDSEDSEPCDHVLALVDEINPLVSKIQSRSQAPPCEHCWLESFGRATTSGKQQQQQRDRPSALIMVCLECKRCLCAGVGVAIAEGSPIGHALSHAHKTGHWVALWFDQPYVAYCFLCDYTLCFDDMLQSAVDAESGAHAPPSDTDGLCHVIRGIANCGNTCYFNALVQCLLALDKLRMWMLGPHAPRKSLGVALKELFVATTPGNNAGAELNPKKLLESLGALNARYTAGTMEDSQELLLDMHKGLQEEEKEQLPPKIRDRTPAVVDSIFQGQISSTLTCKRCLFSSPSHVPFSELSLALPSKGQTTKSVDSPQRSLAVEDSNLKKAQTDAMDKDKASESLKRDATIAEVLWQMENDVHGFLQNEVVNISCTELLLEITGMTEESARVDGLSSQQEILAEAKENTSTEQVTPEGSGKAILAEAKENTSTEQVAPEGSGKAFSRDFLSDAEDSNSLASIEQCLALYFKVEEVEWLCDNCAKASEEAGTTSPVKESFSCSTTNEESDWNGTNEKIIDMSIVQDSQNESTPPNRRKQIDLNVAPVDQIEQEDRKGRADKTVVISKLPPVLTVHLKRFDMVNNEQVKIPGHASFGENLDVGQFLDPRSGDKKNSRYLLCGVIEHIGSSLNTGHNVAYVRAKTIGGGPSVWFRASDSRINKVSVEEVVNCEAYLLFYERIEGSDPCDTSV